jgi:hypothetical protein
MTKVQAAQIYRLMAAAWPNARVTEATPEVFAMGLSDIDFELGRRAVERLIMTSKWMPSIAEFRDVCVSLQSGTRRAAGDAWGDVVRAISRWGIHRVPGVDFSFDDPLVARAVRAIGWTTICNSEMIASERKQFIDLYQLYESQARVDAQSSRAVGALQNQGSKALAPGPNNTHNIVSSVAKALKADG